MEDRADRRNQWRRSFNSGAESANWHDSPHRDSKAVFTDKPYENTSKRYSSNGAHEVARRLKQTK